MPSAAKREHFLEESDDEAPAAKKAKPNKSEIRPRPIINKNSSAMRDDEETLRPTTVGAEFEEGNNANAQSDKCDSVGGPITQAHPDGNNTVDVLGHSILALKQSLDIQVEQQRKHTEAVQALATYLMEGFTRTSSVLESIERNIEALAIIESASHGVAPRTFYDNKMFAGATKEIAEDVRKLKQETSGPPGPATQENLGLRKTRSSSKTQADLLIGTTHLTKRGSTRKSVQGKHIVVDVDEEEETTEEDGDDEEENDEMLKTRKDAPAQV